MTAIQISEQYGIPVSTIYSWIDSGKLPAEKKKGGSPETATLIDAAAITDLVGEWDKRQKARQKAAAIREAKRQNSIQAS